MLLSRSGLRPLLGLIFAIACSSSSPGDGNKGFNPHPCGTDPDCAPGEGCLDGYCAPLCDTDGTCPQKYDCEKKVTQSDTDCKEVGLHNGRGVCELYDHVDICRGGGGTGGGSSGTCTVDGDCAGGQGCKIESNGDNYCSPLCTSDVQCSAQKACVGGTSDPAAQCDDIGQHGSSGVCDLYNGPYGPNTCK
jgi:hypothetical protein